MNAEWYKAVVWHGSPVMGGLLLRSVHPLLPPSLPAAPEARPVPFPVEADSEVGARLGRQDLDPGRVAGLAEDVSVQRVAALVIPLRQEPSTVLTLVALYVEVPIQSHNADSLLLALCRHDGLLADRTPRSKFPVEILDAVDVAPGVHGERDAIQAAVTDHTGEAVGVVGIAGGSQDPLHDGLGTNMALLQGVDVAGLTVGFLLHGIEGLASELAAAGHAGETLHMENLVHCCAPGAFPDHILPTAGTAPKVLI